MARRGRKPKTGVKREPSGRISRRIEEVSRRFYADLEREEVQTLAVGIAARERIYGLTQSVSRDQMAGSFIGRLCLGGTVSREQYNAAMTWLEEKEACALAMSSPRQPSAVDLNRVQGRPVAAEKERQDRQAIEAFRAARKAVQEAQNALRGRGHLLGAMQYVVEQDMQLHHLVGDCRLALNALVKHYERVGSRQAA